MLFDESKFELIGEGVFLFKNIILNKECLKIINILSNTEFSINESKIKSYSLTENVLIEIKNIENKIKNAILSDLNIMPGGFSCITLGNTMGMHHDLYHFNFKEANKHYSIIVYLNDFKGGEIRYPDLNLIYKPEAGDLLIHKSNLRHEVLEVKSDNRYTYTSFLWSKRNVI